MLKNHMTRRTCCYTACLLLLTALCASQGYSTSPIARRVSTKGLPGKSGASQAESLPLRGNGKIAFVAYTESIGQIFIMNPDGSERTQITNDERGSIEPAWSPDGAKIAFVKVTETGTSIYVMNADGTDQVTLTDDGRNPSWSPDGSKIVFHSQGIVVMNADGTNRADITNTAGDSQPAWSPDGLNIVFVQGDVGHSNLHLMNPDGSNQRKLTDGPTSFHSSPTWSPDGKRIAFAQESCVKFSNGYFFCFSEGTSVINRDGSGKVLILDAFELLENYSPAWSPDGKKLAFIGYREGSSFTEVLTINTDGSNHRNLTSSTESEEGDPAWQPAAQSFPIVPSIIAASIQGKRLFLSGKNFDDGATILLNGEEQKTRNSFVSPGSELIGKKTGRKISPGATVILQVRNPSGETSRAFEFTRLE